MSNRYWTAIVVFIVALGLFLWGLSLHPDDVSTRGVQLVPYVAKGLGVIGIISSMILFLLAARRSQERNKL
jgi:hypothetical protein